MRARILLALIGLLFLGALGKIWLPKMKGPQFVFIHLGAVDQNQLLATFSCENPKARFLGFTANLSCTNEKPLDIVIRSTVSSSGQSISEETKVAKVKNSDPATRTIDFGISAEARNLLSNGTEIRLHLSINGDLQCDCVVWARFVDDRLIKNAHPGRIYRTNQVLR